MTGGSVSGSDDRGSGARPGAGAGRSNRDQTGNQPRRNRPRDKNGPGGGKRFSGGNGKGNFPKHDGGKGSGKPGPRQGKPKNRPQRDAEGSGTAKPGPVEPALPEDVDPEELQTEVRRELRPLPKHVADNVAAHLVATGYLLDS